MLSKRFAKKFGERRGLRPGLESWRCLAMDGLKGAMVYVSKEGLSVRKKLLAYLHCPVTAAAVVKVK